MKLLSNLFSGIKGDLILIALIVGLFLLGEQVVYAFTPISDIAVVVSSSMTHTNSTSFNQNFYGYLYSHNFTKSEIESWPFINGLNVGDLVVAFKTNPSDIKIGDIIIYKSPIGDIIHRVIFIYRNQSGYYFTTKGDANPAPIYPIEYNISEKRVIGVVRIVIPYIGYPRYLLTLI